MITQGNNPRRGLVEQAAPSIGGDYAEGNEVIDGAKIHNRKDIDKVLAFFRNHVGTSLDASLATGIYRCSICWYLGYLQNAGLLQAVCVKPDSTTRYPAKHYSANPALWPQVDEPATPSYPSLFREEGLL